MKMKRFFTFGSLCAALIFAGCGKNDGGSSGSGGVPSSGKKLKLAFVVNNPSPFWDIAHVGVNDAVKELGNVEVDFRIPSDGQAATQRGMLDDLIARGVDGIAISVVDADNQTAFLDKIASQTLLITHDSDAPKSKRVCYIGTDNVAAGVEAGKLIKEALPNGGKIMIFVGSLDAANAKERFAGIKKELTGSKVEIIDARTDDADRTRAQRNVEDTLAKYPDIAGLVGLWSYNGPAILNAVKSGGKTGAVKVICFDEEEQTLAGVASGEVYGTVVQQPYEFGKQAITKMAKYLGGDKSALAGGQQIVPTLSIKKDNVAEFKAKLDKQLRK
jgi:ribose transport system substrate-binding protein